MPTDELPDNTDDFGGRLRLAIRAAGTTESAVGRAVGFGPGRMHRLVGKGKNPILSPGPDVIRLLADHLHVEYAWLAIGRGKMKADGRSDDPLEDAMLFARRYNVREDAIAAAADLFRDQELDALEWIDAFNQQARRLDKAGVPRPEALQRAQRVVGRLTRKKAALLKELAELEEAERAAAGRPPTPSQPVRTTKKRAP